MRAYDRSKQIIQPTVLAKKVQVFDVDGGYVHIYAPLDWDDPLDKEFCFQCAVVNKTPGEAAAEKEIKANYEKYLLSTSQPNSWDTEAIQSREVTWHEVETDDDNSRQTIPGFPNAYITACGRHLVIRPKIKGKDGELYTRHSWWGDKGENSDKWENISIDPNRLDKAKAPTICSDSQSQIDAIMKSMRKEQQDEVDVRARLPDPAIKMVVEEFKPVVKAVVDALVDKNSAFAKAHPILSSIAQKAKEWADAHPGGWFPKKKK
ncbi:hypothetical protein DRE_00502 [Drechslerella stenobrocha 248]|uniref:Uncharacterized protein n=1 Tax=Drechslerella stenobrocha 248 TaxID=1043628 RepID=W7HVJ6_9PEZI|nr:hypothetical protein DRE_00502 [Drechslerella stenobrocha 248]